MMHGLAWALSEGGRLPKSSITTNKAKVASKLRGQKRLRCDIHTLLTIHNT